MGILFMNSNLGIYIYIYLSIVILYSILNLDEGITNVFSWRIWVNQLDGEFDRIDSPN